MWYERVRHYLLEPLHIVVLLAAVAAVVGLWGWSKSARDSLSLSNSSRP